MKTVNGTSIKHHASHQDSTESWSTPKIALGSTCRECRHPICPPLCIYVLIAYILAFIIWRQRSIAGAKTVLSGTSQPEKQSTPVDAVYEAVDDATRADISASELPKLSSGPGKVYTPGEFVYQNAPQMTEINQGDTNHIRTAWCRRQWGEISLWDDTHIKVKYIPRGRLARNFTTSTICTTIEGKNFNFKESVM